MPNTTPDLQSLFLFEALDERRLEPIAAISSELLLGKGEHAFRAGDAARHIYGIVRGSCKLYRLTPTGEEVTIHLQRAGDLIAEAAMFDVQRYPADCVALEDSTLLRISAKGLVAVLLEHPELALELMHAYSRRLRQFVSTIEDLSVRDVKARLARWLLANCEESNGLLVCRLACSKKDLAALLGTIPETLSRSLRDLKTRGVIEEREWGMVILRRDVLDGLLM